MLESHGAAPNHIRILCQRVYAIPPSHYNEHCFALLLPTHPSLMGRRDGSVSSGFPSFTFRKGTESWELLTSAGMGFVLALP